MGVSYSENLTNYFTFRRFYDIETGIALFFYAKLCIYF